PRPRPTTPTPLPLHDALPIDRHQRVHRRLDRPLTPPFWVTAVVTPAIAVTQNGVRAGKIEGVANPHRIGKYLAEKALGAGSFATDRKSTPLDSNHVKNSCAIF